MPMQKVLSGYFECPLCEEEYELDRTPEAAGPMRGVPREAGESGGRRWRITRATQACPVAQPGPIKHVPMTQLMDEKAAAALPHTSP